MFHGATSQPTFQVCNRFSIFTFFLKPFIHLRTVCIFSRKSKTHKTDQSLQLFATYAALLIIVTLDAKRTVLCSSLTCIFLGYKISEYQVMNGGYSCKLIRDEKSCWPGDIMTLQLDVRPITLNTLHVKVSC